MQKIFVEEKNWNKKKNLIKITGKEVNHIKNVLRCQEKEKIEIKILEDDYDFLCEIETIEKEQIICRIAKKLETQNESEIYLHIIQGIPKFDKMELIIEKGTELGVKEFTPLSLKRCIAKIDSKDEIKKISRWQKIAETAAKQSKRDVIPQINNVYNIKNIFNLLKEYDIVIVAYENEERNTLNEELIKLKGMKNAKIALIIGPEGGIEEEEISYLEKKGAKPVSLGKRILRTETASIAMSSVVMYELGDFCR